jgi:dienelactone hydrolase
MYLRWRAHALATRGYVVLVADLLGDASGAAWDASWGRQARSVYEGTEGRALLVQRVRGALAELGAHPLVDSQRLAAVGYCFGACRRVDAVLCQSAESKEQPRRYGASLGSWRAL